MSLIGQDHDAGSCHLLALSCSATAKTIHCDSFNCHAEMPREYGAKGRVRGGEVDATLGISLVCGNVF